MHADAKPNNTMLRKTIISLITALCATTQAPAQHAIGQWQVYNSFTTAATSLIDTKKMVYLVNDKNLYAFDKDGEDLISYNKNTGLSEMSISEIYRNYDRDYIVAAYSNANIDVVYDDGRIVNMSEIKDAQTVTAKTINDIAFDGNVMYVATGFGLVKYNMDSHSVLESGIYNQEVTAVTCMAGHIVMLCNNRVMVVPKSEKISQLNKFRDLGFHYALNMEKLSDNIAVSTHRMMDTGVASFIEIDPAAGTFNIREQLNFGRAAAIRRYGDKLQLANTFGLILVETANNEYGYTYHYISIPEKIRINNYVAYNGGTRGNEFWYVNRDGLGRGTFDQTNYTFNIPDGNQIRPIATSVDTRLGRMTQGQNGIYMYNLLATRYPENFDHTSHGSINLLANGIAENITPEELLFRKPTVSYLYANFKIEEDPSDPSTYYLGSWYEGMYKIKDGKMEQKLDWRNMPVDSSYAYAALNIAFDQQKNLWTYIKTAETSRLLMLPAEKVHAKNIQKTDWNRIYIPDFDGADTYNPGIVPLRNPKYKNIVILSQGWGNDYIVFYNTNGTATTTDDRYRMTNKFVDQDSKTFGPMRTTAIVEDLNGSVWVGTSDGVFAIHNAQAMLTDNGTVERIKVPRNDGTMLADYLLANQTVTAIAVDGANRKWIGTSASGLFLTSPDGRQILEHFTSENSILSSDIIYDIVCENGSNHVYVATPTGLLCYNSSSAPAEDNLSDVYAFPNPVKPDYTGWITIKGLMDDTLIKIADASGNVLYHTRSEGGMVIWDGCNESGERVRTGVYYVFASTGGDGAQKKEAKVVTKILVVN